MDWTQMCSGYLNILEVSTFCFQFWLSKIQLCCSQFVMSILKVWDFNGRLSIFTSCFKVFTFLLEFIYKKIFTIYIESCRVLLVSGVDSCKLYCRADTSSNYYLLSSTVVDGTACGPGTFNKCVGGNCVPAGCDHQLYSNIKLGIYW